MLDDNASRVIDAVRDINAEGSHVYDKATYNKVFQHTGLPFPEVQEVMDGVPESKKLSRGGSFFFNTKGGGK